VTSYTFTNERPNAVVATATHVYAGTRNTSGGIDSIVVLAKIPQ
jgi:hypothetical protein